MAITNGATEADLEWWSELKREASPAAGYELAEEMGRQQITIAQFHRVCRENPNQSMLLMFYDLRARNVIPDGNPVCVRDLDEDSRKAWLTCHEEHIRALKYWSKNSEAAIRIRECFDAQGFEEADVKAFLKDTKRLIGADTKDTENVGVCWLNSLESHAVAPAHSPAKPETQESTDCALVDVLVLVSGFIGAVCSWRITRMRFAINAESGLEYAFLWFDLQRADARSAARMKQPPMTEGWNAFEVFLG